MKVIVRTCRTHKKKFLYVYAVTLLRRTRYLYETDTKGPNLEGSLDESISIFGKN